ENEQGERERQHPTGPWPGILTADEKVGSERSADREDRRRHDVPDAVRKRMMPTRSSLRRACRQVCPTGARGLRAEHSPLARPLECTISSHTVQRDQPPLNIVLSRYKPCLQ